MKNRFSIVVAIENLDNLRRNLKNSRNAFGAEVEFILVNVSGQKEDTEIEKALRKYRDIVYVESSNNEKLVGYNLALQKATGNYIAFIEDDISYSTDSFKLIEKYISNTNAKILCMKPFYKFNDKTKGYPIYSEEDKNDLLKNPNQLNLVLESYFFSKEILDNIRFDETLSFEDAKIKFLLEILLQEPLYHFAKNAELYYEKPKANNVTLNLWQYDKEWYNGSLQKFVIPFLENIKANNCNIPHHIQLAILYYIFAKYNCNIGERNKMVLSQDEIQSFFESTSNVLQYIETKLILCNDYRIPRWFKYQMALKKNAQNHIDSKINIKNDIIYMVNSNNTKYVLGNIKEEKIDICAINYDNSKKRLEIDFTVSIQDFLTCKDIEVFAQYRNQKIKGQKTECYPLLQCFGTVMAKKIPCHVSIKLENIDEQEEILLLVEYQGKSYKLQLNFIKIQSRLNESYYSYWNFDKEYCLSHQGDRLVIKKRKAFSGISREMKYFMNRLAESKNKSLTIKNFGLRFIYWMMHPVMKNKRIWVCYDKIYKGGDNAEYLYQYGRKQNDGIKHYYIINKHSNDYKRLKKEKVNLLIFGTPKQRLYCLFAEAILATHKNVISFCGFGKHSRKNFRDLFNAEIICIQHGLTMQEIPQHQNRLEDNTKLYLCASKYEIENLSKPIYGYDKENLKLVGLARFDGLVNKDKKQILISPTWRKSAANTVTRMGDTREYTDEFKKSEYFEIFNSIINNEELINTAKEMNYSILFLLHPVLTAQACDFDTNDYVKVLTVQDGISYEQLLTESSLMVTDYSGVQYDFAYMRKPIVYFHPDELPAQYEDGGINYETMGFGPICKSKESLVGTICDYMKQECKIKQEYVDRANDFFAYDDYSNCERIYHEIQQYLLKKREE